MPQSEYIQCLKNQKKYGKQKLISTDLNTSEHKKMNRQLHD